jgi:hypothetical protein
MASSWTIPACKTEIYHSQLRNDANHQLSGIPSIIWKSRSCIWLFEPDKRQFDILVRETFSSLLVGSEIVVINRICMQQRYCLMPSCRHFQEDDTQSNAERRVVPIEDATKKRYLALHLFMFPETFYIAKPTSRKYPECTSKHGTPNPYSRKPWLL